MAPVEDIVEVYRCISDMEADRALVEVLGPLDIEGYVHDRVSHALPAPSAEPGSLFIAVAAEDAARARRALRQALQDEVLDAQQGEVIEGAGGEAAGGEPDDGDDEPGGPEEEEPEEDEDEDEEDDEEREEDPERIEEDDEDDDA